MALPSAYGPDPEPAEQAADEAMYRVTSSTSFVTDRESPIAPLMSDGCHGDWAAAASMGVFGLGWIGFTFLHAVLMFGSSRGIGWSALGLVGTYCVFLSVGIAILCGAFVTACREVVVMEGHSLTVLRILGPIMIRRKVELMMRSRARIGLRPGTLGGSRGGQPSVIVRDTDGRQHSFGTAADPEWRAQVCDAINTYLAGRG